MKKFIICLCLISSVKATSQNLVLNPSFEDTITCPIGTWAMQCRYWYSASGGSPDYFSEQPDIFCSTSYVPQNGGGYQYPHWRKSSDLCPTIIQAALSQ